MRIADVMTLEPVTIAPEATLEQAAHRMDEQQVRHLPVVEDGRVIGVLSDRQVLERTGWLPAALAPAAWRHVREAMGAAPPLAAPHDDLDSAAVEQVLRGLGCLFVVDENELVGTVSELDLLKLYLDRCTETWLEEDEPPVADHMTEEPLVVVEPGTSLDEAMEVRRSIDIRHLPVVEDGALVGMLSDRDLRRAIGRGQPGSLCVETIMSAPPTTVGPRDSLTRAARLLYDQKISTLPVLDHGRLVGLLSLTDALDRCMESVRSRGSERAKQSPPG